MMSDLSDREVSSLNRKFDALPPEEVIRWAWSTFGSSLASSSSFQTQSVPLLHMISSVCPEIPVLFVDTGFHFPETLAFCDEMKTLLGLNVVVVRPEVEQSEILVKYGEGLYRHDPDLCCYINKVEPLERAISGLKGWISGVRKDQTELRAGLHVLRRRSTGLLGIHPLTNWTGSDVDAYIARHHLPSHPLSGNGYASIGCAPCTRPTCHGEQVRAGRWSGTDKTECGLHDTSTDHLEEQNDERTQ